MKCHNLSPTPPQEGMYAFYACLQDMEMQKQSSLKSEHVGKLYLPGHSETLLLLTYIPYYFDYATFENATNAPCRDTTFLRTIVSLKACEFAKNIMTRFLTPAVPTGPRNDGPTYYHAKMPMFPSLC